MEAAHYAAMRVTEDSHWWYRGNRAIVRRLLATALPQRPLDTLDAGCGTGCNLVWHATLGTAHGLDFAPAALAECRSRGHLRLLRGSVQELPFAAASFDLVTCFEVMYHRSIEDWQQVVREFARVLRPGGVLLSREPAFPFLFGSHDLVVHGARRFRRREVAAAVTAAGLTVELCSYQNLLTFAPALLLRTWERLRGTRPASEHGDLQHGTGWLNRVLGAVLAAEGRWLRFARLPVGSSVLTLARQPG